MSKIYLMVLLGALVLGAYFYGANIERAKCRIQYLQQEQQFQEKNIKNQRGIHDKVYKTGVADIRGILRDKYTIAD